MKKAKKFIMVFSFMLMMVGSTLSVNAQERAYNSCPSCSNGRMVTTTTYSAWTNTGTTRVCAHYSYGYDVKQTRTKMITDKCGNCGYGGTRTTTETRWVCHGSQY